MLLDGLVDRGLVDAAERRHQQLLDEGYSEAYADGFAGTFVNGVLEGKCQVLIDMAMNRFGPPSVRQRVELQLIARVDATLDVISSRILKVGSYDELLNGFWSDVPS